MRFRKSHILLDLMLAAGALLAINSTTGCGALGERIENEAQISAGPEGITIPPPIAKVEIDPNRVSVVPDQGTLEITFIGESDSVRNPPTDSHVRLFNTVTEGDTYATVNADGSFGPVTVAVSDITDPIILTVYKTGFETAPLYSTVAVDENGMLTVVWEDEEGNVVLTVEEDGQADQGDDEGEGDQGDKSSTDGEDGKDGGEDQGKDKGEDGGEDKNPDATKMVIKNATKSAENDVQDLEENKDANEPEAEQPAEGQENPNSEGPAPAISDESLCNTDIEGIAEGYGFGSYKILEKNCEFVVWSVKSFYYLKASTLVHVLTVPNTEKIKNALLNDKGDKLGVLTNLHVFIVDLQTGFIQKRTFKK